MRRDDLGTERLTWRDLLVFVQHAPQDSALAAATNPDAWINPTVQMLREVHHELKVLQWQRTADAHAKPPRGFPDRLPLTEQELIEFKAANAPVYDSMTLDEAADFLGWTRELETKEA